MAKFLFRLRKQERSLPPEVAARSVSSMAKIKLGRQEKTEPDRNGSALGAVIARERAFGRTLFSCVLWNFSPERINHASK
jgi:hypothetical protein